MGKNRLMNVGTDPSFSSHTGLLLNAPLKYIFEWKINETDNGDGNKTQMAV